MTQDKFRKSLLIDSTLLLALTAVFVMAIVTGILSTRHLSKTHEQISGNGTDISEKTNKSEYSVIKKTEAVKPKTENAGF